MGLDEFWDFFCIFYVETSQWGQIGGRGGAPIFWARFLSFTFVDGWEQIPLYTMAQDSLLKSNLSCLDIAFCILTLIPETRKNISPSSHAQLIISSQDSHMAHTENSKV